MDPKPVTRLKQLFAQWALHTLVLFAGLLVIIMACTALDIPEGVELLIAAAWGWFYAVRIP